MIFSYNAGHLIKIINKRFVEVDYNILFVYNEITVGNMVDNRLQSDRDNAE